MFSVFKEVRGSQTTVGGTQLPFSYQESVGGTGGVWLLLLGHMEGQLHLPGRRR